MQSARTGLICLALLVGSLQLSLQAGVIVESLNPGGAAEAAGIRVGDTLISWERTRGADPSQGTFDSPFEPLTVEIEQAPLGAVTLSGTRQGEPFSLSLQPRSWLLEVRPDLDSAGLDGYLAAESRVADGAAAEAAREFQALAARARQGGRPGEAGWLLQRSAKHLAAANQWEEAEALCEEAAGLAGDDVALAGSLRIAEGDLDYEHSRYVEAGHAYQKALVVRGSDPPADLKTADLLHRQALAVHKQEELERAEELHTRALEMRERIAPGSLSVAESLNGLAAAVLFGRRDLDLSERHFLRAREIIERVAPESEQQAMNLHALGLVDWYRGDMAGSEEHLLGALEIRRRLDPGSLEVASTLSSLGGVGWRRSDLEAAERVIREALEIRERISPGSLDVAKTLNNLGLVVWNRGDLPAASDHYQRSLVLKEKFAPGSLTVAMTLNNLGIIALNRGDLASSESYHQRALEIRELKAPDSLDHSMSFSNLGILHWQRGDFDRAEDFLTRALTIREREAPGGIEVAKDLSSLGTLNLKRGDLAAATSYHRRALAIRQEKAPDSLDFAESTFNLGHLARERGDAAAAAGHYRRALEMREKISPGSLAVAISLTSLARLAAEQDRPAEAMELHGKALAIRDRLAPGSTAVAESAFALGSLHRKANGSGAAVGFFSRAVAALEEQQARLGGVQEVRAEYRARRAAVYRDLIDLLVEEGKNAEAFDLLERFRARGLLTQLAERDLVFSQDVPADLERRRRLLAAEYDRNLEALGRLSSNTDAESIDDLHAELASLRRRQAENREEIRRRSPRLAALRHPVPLDVDGVKGALDDGTVLLSYSVGEERTLLFVLAPGGGLEVKRLPLGAKDLSRRIEEFREQIEAARNGEALRDLRRSSADLHRLLVEPANLDPKGAKRLLIVPDGPLNLLPFAALVVPGADAGSPGSYLIETRPLHTASSVTVYDELKRARSRAAAAKARTLLAFGDPRYPLNPRDSRTETGAAAGGPTAAALTARRRALKPLPATREEVETITGLFGEQSTAYYGNDATEERARAAGGGADLIHFAAHGLVDPEVPLDSAIALTIPAEIDYGRDNGLLQAWEIFESVRIDADLVTLSGCETALGREMAGEGMVGLARAFHYAGARSILASLWSVSDRSTARLMKRFYGHLKEGMAKDEALRAAQIAMIRNPASGAASESRGVRRLSSSRDAESWSAPFHWAAFHLMGDWK